jgi:hypothetical protein
LRYGGVEGPFPEIVFGFCISSFSNFGEEVQQRKAKGTVVLAGRKEQRPEEESKDLGEKSART